MAFSPIPLPRPPPALTLSKVGEAIREAEATLKLLETAVAKQGLVVRPAGAERAITPALLPAIAMTPTPAKGGALTNGARLLERPHPLLVEANGGPPQRLIGEAIQRIEREDGVGLLARGRRWHRVGT